MLHTNHRGRRPRAGFCALALAGAALLFLPPTTRAEAGNAGSVTIHLQNAPIQTALRSLFGSAGKNFTIDPGITGTVTVDVTGVPFPQALDAILSGANPPLEAPVTGSIYHVQLQQAAPSPRGATVYDGAFAPRPAEADPHHAYRIPLAHYDPVYMADLVAAFSRKGGAPVIVPSDPMGQQYGLGGSGGFGNAQSGGYSSNGSVPFGGNTLGGSQVGGTPFGNSPFGGSPFGNSNPNGAGSLGSSPFGNNPFAGFNPGRGF